MVCEYCSKDHDGSYGSGRFCNKSCAKGFSSKEKREERNYKISNSLKEFNKPKIELKEVKQRIKKEQREIVKRSSRMRNGPYILVIPPEGYPGKLYRSRYAYEHHVVYWQNTGIIPKKGEVIHHINENKHDNAFENLQLITVASHNSQHNRVSDRELLLVELECFYCKKKFKRERHTINWKIKIGQTRFFCCRSHQVIVQQQERKNIL